MSEELLNEILRKAASLSSEQRRRLISALADDVSATRRKESRTGARWVDLAGVLPYPVCGEDAQEYVSRARRNADNRRIPESGRLSEE